MAAGVTLEAGRLAAFRAYLETELGPAVEAARRDDALLIDGALSAAAAQAELCATIARAGPFGAGNPEPVFALPGHVIAHAEEVGHGHVRARLKSGDGASVAAIAFRAAREPLGRALLENRGRTLHAAGSLVLDRWQGESRTQLRILDVALDGTRAQL